MPTKMISKALMGVMTASLMAAPAFAGGNCGGGNCAVPVQVMDGFVPEFGPMTVRTQNPMGHLRSVQFQRAPNVSITRVHGMMPTANLSDAPSGFTGGCHPTSTTYCRQDMGSPIQVQLAPPPAPIAHHAPVVEQPRVVAIGGGYDPSKFTPRVYGDPTFVPGIAHVPTSIVDRDPVRAQQVLDSGRAVSQPVLGRDTFGGTVPSPHMMRQREYNIVMPGTFARPPQMMQQQQYNIVMPGTFARPPQMMLQQPHNFGQAGAPMLQQTGPFAGSYGSTVGQDGTYWEKVSGPTSFGDTIATQVICKRQLPQRTVNPVVNVPYPVPVQIAQPQGCAPVPHNLHHYEGRQHQGGRYGHAEQGRWTQ